MRTGTLILILTAILLSAGGCPKHTTPIGGGPQTLAERNFQALWSACRKVLKSSKFQLDWQDPRGGVMTTYTVTGGHFFEFWRKDSPTFAHMRENTLHAILRAVRIRIWRREGTDRFDFEVEVRMARLNRKPENLTDSSQAVTLYSSGKPGTDEPWRNYKKHVAVNQMRFEELRRQNNPNEELTPLGRDQDMEVRLVEKIRAAVPQSFSTGPMRNVPRSAPRRTGLPARPAEPPKPLAPPAKTEGEREPINVEDLPDLRSQE